MADNTTSDRPKAKSLKPLRALVPFIRRYRPTLIFAIASLLIASGAMLLMPVALRYLRRRVDLMEGQGIVRVWGGSGRDALGFNPVLST